MHVKKSHIVPNREQKAKQRSDIARRQGQRIDCKKTAKNSEKTSAFFLCSSLNNRGFLISLPISKTEHNFTIGLSTEKAVGKCPDVKNSANCSGKK